jgi:hypothetical protein
MNERRIAPHVAISPRAIGFISLKDVPLLERAAIMAGIPALIVTQGSCAWRRSKTGNIPHHMKQGTYDVRCRTYTDEIKSRLISALRRVGFSVLHERDDAKKGIVEHLHIVSPNPGPCHRRVPVPQNKIA